MITYLNLAQLNVPYLPAFQQSLQRFVATNQFVLGPAVQQFEEAYAAYLGVEHCIGVANATQGLELILAGLGIGIGDEVLAPAYTCDATWVALHNAGATIVPIDADLATRNVNVGLLTAALTPRTRAVVAVHMGGLPCQLEELEAFCQVNGLFLIEDNAQATGALYSGKATGTFGIAATHSFYPTKILGALGDGGAITTSNAALAERLRHLRAYGRLLNGDVLPRGQNARLDELQAHFLLHKLGHLAGRIARHQKMAQLYAHLLGGIAELELPQSLPLTEPVWHLYSILATDRDALQAHLTKSGIQTAIHYPVYLPDAFGLSGHYPIASQIHQQTLSLPIATATEDEVHLVCASIRQFYCVPD